MDRGTITALKTYITSIFKTNLKQEITGPAGANVLQDITDTLYAMISTSGKIIQKSTLLLVGANTIKIGSTTSKIIIVGRYSAESTTRMQTGRLVISIKGTNAYLLHTDVLDNNNADGIGIEISAAVSGSDVNLIITNTSGENLAFNYSEFLTDSTLQGTGVTSFNGLTGEVTIAAIATHLSELLQDENNRTVKDSDIERWNFLVIGSAASDENTDITNGVAKLTFPAPVNMRLTRVPRITLNSAPTGSSVVFDINVNGVSILNTKISIDSTEKTSESAEVPGVLKTTDIPDGAEISIDVDQKGVTEAGKGIKVWFYYNIY